MFLTDFTLMKATLLREKPAYESTLKSFLPYFISKSSYHVAINPRCYES